MVADELEPVVLVIGEGVVRAGVFLEYPLLEVAADGVGEWGELFIDSADAADEGDEGVEFLGGAFPGVYFIELGVGFLDVERC